MKKSVKKAFISTLPVMAGYIFLGIAFGLLMDSRGFGLITVLCMSLFIYAGSMQFVAVDLMTGGVTSLLTIAVTTFMVNARHIFYGISMLERYKNAGKRKFYLIYALTDETYSLVCNENENDYDYYFFVSLFDHIWWITGSLLGTILGELLPFTIKGIDFALTALFVTVFCDQWLTSDNHFFAITGIIASVVCLLIFGPDKFLIPAMILIFVLILLYKFLKKERSDDSNYTDDTNG